MKTFLSLIIILVMFSCNEIVEEKEKSSEIELTSVPKLELIQVNFYHCFMYPSVISYNVTDSSVLFQHNGISLKLIEPPDPEEIKNELVEMFMPISFYFHIDSAEYSYINETVIPEFTEIDYQDTINDGMIDGGGGILLFGYSNDSIKQVHMVNAFTDNQFLLVSKLIDLCVENVSDSLTEDYLVKLKYYYE